MTQTSEPQFIGSAKPFGSTARIYRKRGWTGIFPLPAREKHPPPNGVTGRRGVFPTDDTLIEWLNDTPTCKGNIGIRLGNPIEIDGNEFEVIGIDVDDHRDDPLKPKVGGEQLQYLEQKYGKLPDTWINSPRNDGISGHRFFLVPKGLAYRGNCGEHGGDIDIIQRVHRYTVVYPSYHPKGGQYLWYPPGVKPLGMAHLVEYYAELEKKASLENNDLVWKDDPDQELDLSETSEIKKTSVEGISHIPWVQELAYLPESWIEFLTRGGTKDKAVKIDGSEYHIGADLDSSTAEIKAWAKSTLPEPNEKYQEFGGACKRMRGISNLWVDRLENAGNLHPVLIEAHNNILRYGLEGHTGWLWACEQANEAFFTALRERDDSQGRLKSARSEVARSYYGVLRKLKAEVEENAKLGLNIVGYCDCYEDTNVSSSVSSSNDSGNLQTLSGDQEPPINYDHIPMTKAKEPREYEDSDDGNAHHLADLHEDMIKHSINSYKFIIWDGEEWVKDEKQIINDLFRRVAQRYREYGKQLLNQYQKAVAANGGTPNGLSQADKALEKRGKDFIARGIKCGNAPKISAALRVIQSIPGIATRQEEWDTDPYKLGLAHGVIWFNRNPAPGKRSYKYYEQAEKKWMITLKTAVDFIPWAEQESHKIEDIRLGYEEFNKYLDLFIPKNLQYWLQLLLGHTLIGGNREKIAIYLYGGKDAGKSTIAELFNNALGEYACTINPSLFKQQHLNPALARALPKRVVSGSEAGDMDMDANLLKAITGNEPVVVEIKNSNNLIEMVPQFVPIISTNSPPVIRGEDAATRERIVAFPFENSVQKTKENNAARDRLMKYGGTAILAWAIEGCVEYLKVGLRKDEWPEEIKHKTSEFTAQMSEIGAFIEDCLIKTNDESDRLPTSMVFDAYMLWCDTNRVKDRDTESKFIQKLQNHEFQKKYARYKVKGQQCFVGVKLKVKIPK